jgi:protein-S-isoprenylcysteine O-methyltransferase
MLSCGSNFSHTIMEEKDEEHKLVTNGIYSILRHPSYFGW